MTSNNVHRYQKERKARPEEAVERRLNLLSAMGEVGRDNEGSQLNSHHMAIVLQCTMDDHRAVFSKSDLIAGTPKETREKVYKRFKRGITPYPGERSKVLGILRESLQLGDEPLPRGKVVMPRTSKETEQMVLNGSENRDKRPREKKSTILGKLRRLFHPKRKAFVRTQFE